jgi:redox-sensitive bicupin YhaK (pirin superfamily)
MKTKLIRATERGHANHGWLDTYHTFSFAGFQKADQMNFGALRVLNDDFVVGGMGFSTHPHANMEIVSIPLEGALEHGDSMGNKTVIKNGEVQIMTAGTGVHHSEKNHSLKEPVKFLQIWVFPEKENLKPSYDQKYFEKSERINNWQTVVSPVTDNHEGVKINQQAWFSLSNLNAGKNIKYQIKGKNSGVYFYILEGSISVNNQELNRRDGIGFWDTDHITLNANSQAEILAIEVPMTF